MKRPGEYRRKGKRRPCASHAAEWEMILAHRGARLAGRLDEVARLAPLARRARCAVIRAHRWLALSMAARSGDRIDLRDRFGAGLAALDDAIEHFDPERGRPFSWYARFWIRKAIKREIDLLGYPCRLPAWLEEQKRTIPGKRSAAAYEALCQPTIDVNEAEETLAEATALPWSRGPDSEGDGWPHRDIEAFHSVEPSPLWQVARALDGPVVRRAVRALDRQKREVIKRRFGLGCTPETLERVGRRLGLTAEGARGIQNAALCQATTISDLGDN